MENPDFKKLEEKQFLKRIAVKEDERMKKVILLEKALAAKEGMKAREEGILFLNNNKTKSNIQTTSSGLQYEIVQ